MCVRVCVLSARIPFHYLCRELCVRPVAMDTDDAVKLREVEEAVAHKLRDGDSEKVTTPTQVT